MRDIKKELIGTMTSEFEALAKINNRAGNFNYYKAQEAMKELSRENKVESMAIGTRIKWRRLTLQGLPMAQNTPTINDDTRKAIITQLKRRS